ncbi:MAG: hypothetical protein R3234_00020 [Thermoanaerobaculia bacterium]|nr:hypothetical protein [Thermoanaerobaculia bacterium]
MASSDDKTPLENLLSDSFGSAFESVRRSLTTEIQRHTEARERQARSGALQGLRESLARLDACRRQTDLLTALLEEAGGFASRTALWLTALEGPRGWASFGFGESSAIEDLELGYGEEPWRSVAEGSGWVEIEGRDAAALAAELDAPVPKRAILIPLVLRDRIAAVLYADSVADDEDFEPDALKILTLGAALLLEIQGLRSRNRTPTLHPRGTVAPQLELWEEEAEAPTPDTVRRPPEAEVTEEVEEPEPAPPAAEMEEIPEESEALWAEEEAPPEETAALETPEEEALPEAEVEAIPEAELEGEEAYEASEIEGFEVEDLPEVEEAADLDEGTPTDVAATEVPEEPSVGAEPTVRISPDALSEAQEAGVEPPVETPSEPPPPAVEEETTQELETVEELEEPTEDISEDRTVHLDRSTVPEPPPEPPGQVEAPPPEPPSTEEGPPPAEPAPPPEGTSPEVAPPPDLQGPGLAFRGEAEEEPTAVEEDETATLHEEARRLARLLVSEIKLYNEEEVEAGRQNKDLYERLQEDIDRSRQMYRERVDPRIRDEVDYFRQELVNILGGGDPDTLGT